MNRVVHFEIQAEKPEWAAKFYKEIFGWSIEKWPDPGWDYWIVMTAEKDSKEPGINGGLLKRPAKTPPQEYGTNAYVCTVQVEDFDKTAESIKKTGGIVAMPKFAIPGMAWQGYFLDTEGNTFGVHQPDKNAK
ncbi:VOC family protein [Candidatus Woesearchaeota archaeon]|nr:VOC family protein [Candidatus Woesearchaeota archaeon]